MKVWMTLVMMFLVASCTKGNPAHQTELNSENSYEEIDGVKVPKDRPISFHWRQQDGRGPNSSKYRGPGPVIE